jgi:hypothetical protein
VLEISRRIASAKVVLPDPLSPTMPRVSPARTDRLASLTAFTWPTVLRRKPFWIGNQTRRFSVRTTSGAPSGDGGRTALLFGGQQLLGIGMLRIGEDFGRGALFDDLAALHDADPVGDAAHDAKVMGDEQEAEALGALEVGQKIKNLRLDGDVQRGGGFVRDQKLRPVGQRHRDHHPLALPPGKLVRIGTKAAFRLADADLGQQFHDPGAGRSPGQALVQARLSAICFSMVCSGFSDVIGSWKMKLMSLPRTLRRSRSDAPTICVPR